MYLIENDKIGLLQYTHDDDYDMFQCWQDMDTKKGYNFDFDIPYEDFCKTEIQKFKFWVTVVDKSTNEKVGCLRLGLDEVCPDLAIWIYPKYRKQGYGRMSFALALQYVFENFPYPEISAGCYQDNIGSQKILRSIGFQHHPEGDIREPNELADGETVQMEFRIKRFSGNSGD